MELEQALAKILEQEQTIRDMNDQCESLKVMNESFVKQVSEQEQKINELKQINMRYFERLTMETKQIEETNSVDSISKEQPKGWDEFLNEW